MADKPYPMMRVVPLDQSAQGRQMSTLVQIELADTFAVGLQLERVSAQTRVSLPLPPDQPTIEIAALIRLRSLLDAQIAAMTQSP